MSPPAFCAVVPAAGTGVRMGGGRPKQYLPLAGASVIEWALSPLLEHGALESLVVVLAPGDEAFAALSCARDPRLRTAVGGSTRAESVRAGLDALAQRPPETPVLVHDAARPCLPRADLDRLLAAAAEPAGALLAVPVRDTLKRADGGGRVAATVAREDLWQALTPQGFPLGGLGEALHAAAAEPGITDEAAAMERLGHAPRLIEGDPSNIKITRPGDLPLAAAILGDRGAARVP